MLSFFVFVIFVLVCRKDESENGQEQLGEPIALVELPAVTITVT